MGHIRRATDADLEAIHVWLRDEKARNIEGNFLCNWNIIARAQKDRELLVYIDAKTRSPVAFQLGGLLRSGILAVRAEYRGKGIGRKMVNHCIQTARRTDQPVLSIQCAPESSVPFWKHMGFVPCLGARNLDDHHYYQILPQALPAPSGGKPCEVTIAFFPESRGWEESTAPVATHKVRGIRASDGVVHLSDRVAFADEALPDIGELVVEIAVDGVVLYGRKAKYPEAAALGVRRACNGYFIDAVNWIS